MGIPQIIFLILMGISLLSAAHLHGKPRPDYDFWSTLISVALSLLLLYWGGFFS